MNPTLKNAGRQLLPWLVSAGALIYVFGFQIDWEAIPKATAAAWNFPLFVAITVWDKVSFFIVWGLFHAAAIRRFIEPVPIRQVMAVKGASELVRSVNNSLADATFLFGVSQLVRAAGVGTVVAIASIPFVTHFAVLLIQVSVALPFLENGIFENRDVVVAVALSWVLVAVAVIGMRHRYFWAAVERLGLAPLLARVKPRELLPYVGWFMLFAAYDVLIQGLASRAFGLEISWVALTARIPILYIALMIPSLGNFGTREIAWAGLFSDYGSPDALTAFALWTNTIFLAMHVIIGSLFVGRAFALVRDVRAARREGVEVPKSILTDPVEHS